ncbi:MAG: hypothetical protein DI586_06010 [Micavibrio aeruginosavorus]|uniref:Uncharacterized protein n=1 Tax=Micavibrio aeruginosavorus TaxID=349221 RepID=A0A2W5HJ61_9BACT|nr:MAG: hypothetical protein DI586_06010 [Micavibrio aeruginosavorus]
MTGQSGKILDIKSKRHELPIDVILFHMVNFRQIKALPVNRDCTALLKAASERVLSGMFDGGKYYVETFMPRRCEFERRLAEEILSFSKGEWALAIEKACLNKNDNSQISA